MKNKGQSDRLTVQQIANDGVIGIFDKNAQIHDASVAYTSSIALMMLTNEYPKLKFRYRASLLKHEINDALQKIDPSLGQTLFLKSASIKPDGGIVEVLDDHGDWRVILVSVVSIKVRKFWKSSINKRYLI